MCVLNMSLCLVALFVTWAWALGVFLLLDLQIVDIDGGFTSFC